MEGPASSRIATAVVGVQLLAAQVSNTRGVNIQNANDSISPVVFHLVVTGWQGPSIETYPTLPASDRRNK